jgi:tetratricopeptide (TPR) repeat protein
MKVASPEFKAGKLSILKAAIAFNCLSYLFLPLPQVMASDPQWQAWENKLTEARQARENQNFAQAITLLQELIEKSQAPGAKEHRRRAYTALAAVYFFQDKLDNAEEINRQALSLCDEPPTLSNSDKALVLADLAEVLIARAEKLDPQSAQTIRAQAAVYLGESRTLAKKAFSRNNPSLGSRLNFIAELYEKAGYKEESTVTAMEAGTIINAFLADMSIKIKRAWQPPKRDFGYSAEIGFEVLDHGLVQNPTILTSANDAPADQACIKAVETAQPFSDITKENPEDKLFLSFRFDYNFSSEAKLPTLNTQKLETTSKNKNDSTDGTIAREQKKALETKKRIKALRSVKNHNHQELALEYARLSSCLRNIGAFEQSVKNLKTALEEKEFASLEEPGTLILLCELGATYLRAMEPELAEKTLTLVVESPNFGKLKNLELKQRAYEDLGHALSTLGRYAEAQKYYLEKRTLNETDEL